MPGDEVWSTHQYAAYLATQRGGARVVGEASRPQQAGESSPAPHVLRGPVAHAVPPFPLGEGKHTPYAPYRSRTEQRYAELLEGWEHDSIIRRWYYEPMRLALAPHTTLTVDFLVQMPSFRDTILEFHEVKSKWIREDSWVKLKMAAARYPMFRFVLAQYTQGAWSWKRVPAH